MLADLPWVIDMASLLGAGVVAVAVKLVTLAVCAPGQRPGQRAAPSQLALTPRLSVPAILVFPCMTMKSTAVPRP